MTLKQRLFVLALALQPFAFADVGENSSFRFKAAFLPALRNGYIFPGSNSEKTSVPSLLSGKDFVGAGKSSGFRFLGVEAEGLYRMFEHGGPFLNARLVPFGLQVPNGSEQRGLEWMITAGYELKLKISEGFTAGFQFGGRFRRWTLDAGAFPDSGHGGLVLAALVEGESLFTHLELGLMGMGVGNTSSLGIQRDSSSLRLRTGYRVSLDSVAFMPAIEFFHTHRDFYASQVVAGENSLFVDEVSLLLSVGIEW